MRSHRRPTFEALENKRCLTATAIVSAGGDLRVSGAADGPIEIVALADGNYRVSDNGVVIADSLAGVTDDIRINLEDAAEGAVNTVTLTLGDATVDEVYANLGDGDNSFEIIGGTVDDVHYIGGDGDDAVTLGGTITGSAKVRLGDGDNSLTTSGDLGRLSVQGGDGADAITLGGVFDRSVGLSLGDGDNTTTVSAEIDGSLTVSGGDGDDAVTLTETAIVADNFFARLGDGDNSVTHNGTVDGDFRVVTANEDDVVTIADTATVGGDTILGLGEQFEFGHCGGQFGGFNVGNQLRFFFRGAR